MSDESLSEIIQSPFKAPPTPKAEASADVKPAEQSVEAVPPAVKEEPKAEDKTEAKSEKPRDDSGRFAKPDDKPAKPEMSKADIAAIMDERRKRQELEARLREFESKPENKPPSVFEDEDKAINSRVDQGTRQLREMLFKQSVKYAQRHYGDTYSEAEMAFMDAASRDERLFHALRGSDDPGEYIYTVGIQIKELADVGGDFMKYREKIEAGNQAKLDEQSKQITALQVELEALKTAQKDLDSLPRSLNDRSSGPAPKSADTDDDDIKSITRFGKN